MQSIFQHDGGLPDDVDSCDPEIFGGFVHNCGSI